MLTDCYNGIKLFSNGAGRIFIMRPSNHTDFLFIFKLIECDNMISKVPPHLQHTIPL